MKRIFWPFFKLAVDDADVNDDAAIIVVDAVENQRPRRRIGIALGRRKLVAQLGDQFVDPLPGLGRHQDRVLGAEAEHLLDFLGHLDRRALGRSILLMTGMISSPTSMRRIRIGHRLRLHALRGIDDQDRPFARLQGLLHFVMEIDMPRRVDEIEHELFAVMLMEDGDGRRLDGDPALALQVHVIEHLVLESRVR